MQVTAGQRKTAFITRIKIFYSGTASSVPGIGYTRRLSESFGVNSAFGWKGPRTNSFTLDLTHSFDVSNHPFFNLFNSNDNNFKHIHIGAGVIQLKAYFNDDGYPWSEKISLSEQDKTSHMIYGTRILIGVSMTLKHFPFVLGSEIAPTYLSGPLHVFYFEASINFDLNF